MLRWLMMVLLVVGIAEAAAADKLKPVAADDQGLTIQGYDTVAYFTTGKPAKGDARFIATWQGGRWQFANAEHRDKFLANPDQYAPQFGAYCTMAMSRGIAVVADPLAWKIVDGRLYLKAKPAPSWTDFDKARPHILAEAQSHWQKMSFAE